MNLRSLLWSNAVISLAAAGCVVTALELSGMEWQNGGMAAFALGISAATWWAYSWQRHVKSTRPEGLRPEHQAWQQRHRRRLRFIAAGLLPLALLPVGLTAWESGHQDVPLWLGVGIALAAGVTALYAGLPGHAGSRQALRRLPGLKMIWIGLTWSIITALWPIGHGLLQGQEALVHPGWVALDRFLVIAALTLPFDLRDRAWDSPRMRTWPQWLGPNGTRSLALAFVAAAMGVRWLAHPEATSVALGLVPMAWAVSLADEERSAGYYVGLDALLLVDAAWLSWGRAF